MDPLHFHPDPDAKVKLSPEEVANHARIVPGSVEVCDLPPGITVVGRIVLPKAEWRSVTTGQPVFPDANESPMLMHLTSPAGLEAALDELIRSSPVATGDVATILDRMRSRYDEAAADDAAKEMSFAG